MASSAVAVFHSIGHRHSGSSRLPMADAILAFAESRFAGLDPYQHIHHAIPQ
jgi:hypothetical protein